VRLLKRSLLIPLFASLSVAAASPISDSRGNETTTFILLGGSLVLLGLCQRWFVRR